MAERKWKKAGAWMIAWIMAVVFAISGTEQTFASTSYVSSVNITLDVTPTVGNPFRISMWDIHPTTARS